MYALFLSGSNVIAPIICGFINDHQGYFWVFYWPAIFCAVALVFLFLFLEESNYDRKFTGVVLETPETAVVDPEKPGKSSPERVPTPMSEEPVFRRKTYFQKLSLIDKPREFRMGYRILNSFKFITWPCIFYGIAIDLSTSRVDPLTGLQPDLRTVPLLSGPT